MIPRAQVKTLPPKETQTELHDINIKQLELERQGVELEKTIRQLTEQDDKQQKGKHGWPPAVGVCFQPSSSRFHFDIAFPTTK